MSPRDAGLHEPPRWSTLQYENSAIEDLVQGQHGSQKLHFYPFLCFWVLGLKVAKTLALRSGLGLGFLLLRFRVLDLVSRVWGVRM